MPPERVVRLGLLGFGSVGRAFALLLAEEAEWLARDRGVRLVLTGVTTGRSGTRIDEQGLDIRALLLGAAEGRTHGPALEASAFAAQCPADVVVETLPLEPFTGGVAIQATRAALVAGRSVVSANKGPVAHALRELRDLAREHRVCYRFESAVADGLPVFSLIGQGLPAADVTALRGLLNSTSNVVLHALAKGDTLTRAVSAAQAMGIAEVDPAYDLDGWDAAVKLAALSAAVWDLPLDLEAVERQPVDEGAVRLAVDAAARGHRLVSLASLMFDARPAPACEASVRLVEIGPGHDFFALSGTSLGLQIRSRLLCPVTVSSHEPRVRDTAYGLLADVLAIASG